MPLSVSDNLCLLFLSGLFLSQVAAADQAPRNVCHTRRIYRPYLNSTCDVAKDIFAVKFVILFLYCLIVFVGLVGNLLVVWVVSRIKSMQSITNIFIANLAVSDILMCLVATPFTPVSLYMESWTLPEMVCKLLPITMGVSVYVSTLTSMAIALDRFFVIVHPFVPRMRIWLCFVIIILIWIVAVLISMPLAVYQEKNSNLEGTIWTCQENWPKESSREVFTIVSLFLQFIVPCSIISVCYFRISLILRKRLRNRIGRGTKLRLQAENEIKRKKRTNSILIAMVAIFVICWIPLNILLIGMNMLSEERIRNLVGPQNFTLVFFICHLFGMSSTVYNPFLYAWMNNNFKREVHRILPCFCARSLQTQNQLRNNQQPTGGVEYSAVPTNVRQVTTMNNSNIENPPITTRRISIHDYTQSTSTGETLKLRLKSLERSGNSGETQNGNKDSNTVKISDDVSTQPDVGANIC